LNDAPIAAETIVAAPCEQVFSFLSDLRNHWLLADRMVEVVSIDEGAGEHAQGGRVRLQGPLGLRRTVATKVTQLEPPSAIAGQAQLAGTSASVRWQLLPVESGQTRVLLEARVERASAYDRALLALGGRRWLRRRFEHVLQTLSLRVA
jgi:uncharacterized protein YndB with AHSA1/START domain